MTVFFGDGDPEDAWDPDDPLPVLADNLARRVALLVGLRHLDDRAQLRIRLLGDDLRHLFDRLVD